MRTLWVLTVLAIVAVPLLADDKPPAGEPDPLRDANVEPEEVARQFFLAMLEHDPQEIQRWIVPHKQAALLWSDERLPPDRLKEAQKRTAGLKFYRLKAGDTITPAKGEQYVVTAQMVDESHMLVIAEGFRMPVPVERRWNGWKVNAEPFVAPRREAAEAKQADPAEPPKK